MHSGVSPVTQLARRPRRTVCGSPGRQGQRTQPTDPQARSRTQTTDPQTRSRDTSPPTRRAGRGHSPPIQVAGRSPGGRRHTRGSADGDGDACASRWRRPGRPAASARSGSRRSRRSPAPGAGARPAWRPSARTTAARCPPRPSAASVGLLPRAVVDPYLDPADAPVLRPGHPGDGHRPGGQPVAPAGRVDPRLGLDRRLRGPAARHPVRVEVGEPWSAPARSPTCWPRRSRTGRAPPSGPGSRARPAAARRSSPTASSASRPSRSTAVGVPQVQPSTDRLTTWSAPSSGSPRRAGPAAARRASGRCRSGPRRPRWRRRPA